ncbi:unnamed protein product [Paramecium primaurelia]|uniref:Uncharacterized protein n=1 Tax=Paramecium primaurelia TaxID=5886 RepID=A0A8S1MJR9_PARPR|nr:unnamed protein product [Paramecium primaurelia]
MKIQLFVPSIILISGNECILKDNLAKTQILKNNVIIQTIRLYNVTGTTLVSIIYSNLVIYS